MPEYKNHFDEPAFYEHVIRNDEGKVGTIRIKPSTLLWKPKGSHSFYSIDLQTFHDFVVEHGRRANK